MLGAALGGGLFEPVEDVVLARHDALGEPVPGGHHVVFALHDGFCQAFVVEGGHGACQKMARRRAELLPQRASW